MRICMLTAEYPPHHAGIGGEVYNVAVRLAKRGHKVVVITRGNWKRGWIHELNEGVEVYRVWFIPIYPFHVKLHGIFVNRLLQHLQTHFDVVHLHTPLVPHLSRLVPYVAEQHSTILGDIKMRKTRDLYSLGLRLLQYPLVAIDRRISRNASSVKAVSRGCAQELQQLYGICPEKVVVIPTGVDTAFFTPAEKPTTATPYVLYAARLDARKGIEDFVECATYVCREKPETKFVVAGGGYLATKMKRKVHTAGLDGNFQFTGFVSQRVLLQYYREASVYILPSYYEGNPHSLLEAMSCATPCIATQVIGSSEIIVDNESGFLVPPGNPARLAEATLTLLDNKQLRKKIGENARSRVLQNYDFNTIVDRIEEWYRTNLR